MTVLSTADSIPNRPHGLRQSKAISWSKPPKGLASLRPVGWRRRLSSHQSNTGVALSRSTRLSVTCKIKNIRDARARAAKDTRAGSALAKGPFQQSLDRLNPLPVIGATLAGVGLVLSSLLFTPALDPPDTASVSGMEASLSEPSKAKTQESRFRMDPSSLPSEYTVKQLAALRTPGTYLLDTAARIDDKTARKLDEIAYTLRSQTGSELVVVTVNSKAKGTRSPKQMATQLFNTWRLGDAQKNNGILILIDMEERRVQVEVGAGLDSAYEERGQFILESRMVPKLKSDDVASAVRSGAKAYAALVRGVDRNDDYDVAIEGVPQGVGALVGGIAGLSLAGRSWRTQKAEEEELRECFGPEVPQGSLQRLREALPEELSQLQATERELGSAVHGVWAGAGRQAVISRGKVFSPFYQCESCRGWTKWQGSETIVPPTTYTPGVRQRFAVCMHCNDYDSWTEVIPEYGEDDDDFGGGFSDGGGGGADF